MPPLEDPSIPPPDPTRAPTDRLVLAAAALDADGLISPAAALIRGGRLEAVGPPATIGRPEGVAIEDRRRSLLLPALVNAHVHLDLWSVGEVSLEAGFDQWLAEIRSRRPVDPADVAASVRGGIAASIAGGVAAVGDIAGAFGTAAAAAFAEGPLGGTAFIEVFGIGRRLDAGLEAVARLRDVASEIGPSGRIGLSPHAPYSCAEEVYAAAAATGLPVTTHLAETPEEAAFTRTGTGPLVDLLRRLGTLGEADEPPVSRAHPIDQLASIEPRRPWLVAHVNYLAEPDEPAGTDERRAAALRSLGATVVYCPRAARALGHPRPGRDAHPWRFLREHGVEVALGTDGRPCLDRGDRLTTLDDIRLLVRDGADPVEAVAMATVGGARGLGLDAGAVRFRDGAGAGLLAMSFEGDDPIRGLVESEADPEWVRPLAAAAFGPVGAGG